MKIFYDTEFHERGPRAAVEFISIGMVREDGEEYYAISSEVQWWAVYSNEWLRANVLPHLPGKIRDYGNGGGTFEPDEGSGLYLPRVQIAQEVANFCYTEYGQTRDATKLWAYYGAYDHVMVAQLFGRMIDLPDHMPMYTRDVKHIMDMVAPGVRFDQDKQGQHNALADARWLADVWQAVYDAAHPIVQEMLLR